MKKSKVRVRNWALGTLRVHDKKLDTLASLLLDVAFRLDEDQRSANHNVPVPSRGLVTESDHTKTSPETMPAVRVCLYDALKDVLPPEGSFVEVDEERLAFVLEARFCTECWGISPCCECKSCSGHDDTFNGSASAVRIGHCVEHFELGGILEAGGSSDRNEGLRRQHATESDDEHRDRMFVDIQGVCAQLDSMDGQGVDEFDERYHWLLRTLGDLSIYYRLSGSGRAFCEQAYAEIDMLQRASSHDEEFMQRLQHTPELESILPHNGATPSYNVDCFWKPVTLLEENQLVLKSLREKFKKAVE